MLRSLLESLGDPNAAFLCKYLNSHAFSDLEDWFSSA